jgi:predicted O-linked N-acetylglucosamine transferase (SPINDLY family)
MGASILSSLNLTQLIAQDISSYEDKVLALSQDANALIVIKQDLAVRIINAHQQPKRLTHSIENGLLKLYPKSLERVL